MAVKGAIIAIDFDGTVVTHAYPHMGMDAGAVPVLKEARGERLQTHPVHHAQRTTTRKSRPMVQGTENSAVRHQRESRAEVLTSSPKVHADLYIDDSALGCPIRFMDGVARPVADWVKIRQQLVEAGYLD